MGPFVSWENYDCSLHGFQPDTVCEWQTAEPEKSSSGYSTCDPCRETCVAASNDFQKSTCSADFLTYALALLPPIAINKQAEQVAGYEKELPAFLEAETELIRFVELNWDAMKAVDPADPRYTEFVDKLRQLEYGHLKGLRDRYWDVADFHFRSGIFYLQISHYMAHYSEAMEASSYYSAAAKHFSTALEINRSLMFQSLDQSKISDALRYATQAKEQLFAELDGYAKYNARGLRWLVRNGFDDLAGIFGILDARASHIKNPEIRGYVLAGLGGIYLRRVDLANTYLSGNARDSIVDSGRNLALSSSYQAAGFFRDAAVMAGDPEKQNRLKLNEAEQRLRVAGIFLDVGGYANAEGQAELVTDIVTDYFRSGLVMSTTRQQNDVPFYLADAEAKLMVAMAKSRWRNVEGDISLYAARDSIFQAIENKAFLDGDAIFKDPDLAKLSLFLRIAAKLNAPANEELMMISWINGRIRNSDKPYPYLAVDPRVAEIMLASERGALNGEHITILADLLQRYEGETIPVDQIVLMIAVGEGRMKDLLERIRLPMRVVERLVAFATVEKARVDVEAMRGRKKIEGALK